MPDNVLSISLTRAEAIVLFESLSRLEEAQWIKSPDEVELKVFWKIEGQLEKMFGRTICTQLPRSLEASRNEVDGR